MYRMKCKIENKDEKPQEICDHIKKNVVNLYYKNPIHLCE